MRAVKYPLHWFTVLFSLYTDNILCSLSAQTILMDFRDLAHHAFVLANFFKFEKNNVDFDRKQTRDSVWQNKKNKNFMVWKKILRKQSQSQICWRVWTFVYPFPIFGEFYLYPIHITLLSFLPHPCLMKFCTPCEILFVWLHQWSYF